MVLPAFNEKDLDSLEYDAPELTQLSSSNDTNDAPSGGDAATAIAMADEDTTGLEMDVANEVSDASEDLTKVVNEKVDGGNKGTEVINESETENLSTVETSEVDQDVSLEALLANLDKQQEGAEEATEASKEAEGKLGEIVEKIEDKELKQKYDELVQANAKKDTEIMKLSRTIDAINSEYEKTLDENIKMKYGNASESKIVDAINNNERLQEIVAMEIASSDSDNNSVLIETYKNALESLTGNKFGDIVNMMNRGNVDTLNETSVPMNLESRVNDDDDLYL